VALFYSISIPVRPPSALHNIVDTTAEKASDLKSAILRNMSHEVRTPITAIIGYSKILADSLEGTPQEQADKIHEASQHLMKTIDSVLELSKLEADASDLDREIARLDQAVEWALDPLYRQAERHDLELQTVIPDQPIEGYWNQEALYKIVLQLVENAIKFTPAGGRIEIRVREEQNEGVLEVEDTGIGMDAGEVESLFDPFRQASAGLTREHEGVGLGLTIVREITEALGGTIDVDTETGEGARVTVRLPQNKKM